MKKLFLLFVIFVLPFFAMGQNVSKILEERLEAEPFGSGFSAVIVDEAGTKFYNSGKISKQANAKSINENTVYEIGSITKAFVGILLAEAVGRGEVKLDDPISKHLPKDVVTPKFGGKEITLLDLTTHHSGLPRLPGNFNPKDNENPYADYTVKQMYEFLGQVKLEKEIGSEYAYSNFGAGLLAHILSLKAKMSFADLVKARILKPLEMNDTSIVLPAKMKSDSAIGYNVEERQTSNWDWDALAGAGALRSTAGDMAKFIRANLGLSKTSISESLAESQKVRRTTDNPNTNIGLGWHTLKIGSNEIVWHNGGTGGFRSFVGIDKAAKKGVFVVTNSPSDVDDIGLHLLENKIPLRKIAKPRNEITLSEEVLQKYVGEYELAPTFSIVITREGKRLFAQATNQPKFELFAEKEDEFFLKVVDAQISFSKDDNGKIESLILHQNGNDSPGEKIK